MDDTDELDRVAAIFEGVSNRSKLAILLGLDDSKSLKEIAKTLGITQQGLEKNLDKMVDAGLIALSQDSSTYQLTPIGEYFVRLLQEEWDTLVEAKRIEQEKETEARKKAEAGQQALKEEEDDGFTFEIDDETWNQIIQTQKWTLADTQLRELLDLPSKT